MKAWRSKFALLVAVIAVMALALSACSEGADRVSGDEVGLYYCDVGADEYNLMLGSESKFTLNIKSEFKSGSYTLDGNALVLKFNDTKSETINAVYSGETISFTYSDESLTFRRKTPCTVSYDSKGGTAVESDVVYKGRSVHRPADPTFTGNIFLGWFKDEDCTAEYSFADPVLQDMTLYAKWADAKQSESEFKISFEVGDANLPAIESKTTVKGKLLDLPTPAARSGYVFRGWWVSMFDSIDKLAYMCDENTLFDENTTLYACWEAQTTFNMPKVQVNENGIYWEELAGATFTTNVKSPSGETSAVPMEGLTSPFYPFAFDEIGEYDVTFSVSLGSEIKSVHRYFNAHALKKVSLFNVVGSSLIFNHVEHAEKYLITVKCGDEAHNHTDFDNGRFNTFSFANCPMKEGGIEFTVKAQAEGYLSSTSDVYVYNKSLDGIEELFDDPDTETVSWNKIPFATGYYVSVTCQNSAHNHTRIDVGNATSYSYKECSGNITIKVTPIAKGYYSPTAKEINIEKKRIATPSGIKVVGTNLIFDAVDGASSYDIEFEGSHKSAFKNGDSKEISFDLNGLTDTWEVDKVYTIKIKALASGGKDSLYTDDISLYYGVMQSGLKYSGNVLTWKHVIGADSYEVSLNGTVLEEEVIGNKLELELNARGKNTLSVKANIGGRFTQSVSLDVNAYSVTFVNDDNMTTVYKAVGDKLNLPSPEKEFMDFMGWYNVPGGAANNGLKYEEDAFRENADLTLYAYWKNTTFNVQYVYDGEEVEDGTPEQGKFVYSEENTLLVPSPKDKTKGFLGWFLGDEQFTDGMGRCFESTLTHDIVLTARWETVFSFTIVGTNCTVSKAAGNIQASILIIPEKYEQGGAIYNVSAVGDFSNCTSVEEISIPDTVRTISATTDGFSGCTSLKRISFYETGNASHSLTSGYYDAIDGVLVRRGINSIQLVFVPQGIDGNFEIPQGIDEINGKVFENANISTVTIPSSVSTIYANAFANCTSLEVVYIEEGAEDLVIQDGAFAGCSSLRELNLPMRTSSVTAAAFTGCGNLVLTATKGAKYENYDDILFGKTGNSRTSIIYFPSTKEPYCIENGNRVANKYKVPAGITEIGDNAFTGNAKLQEIELPDSLTKIGNNAFYGCALKEVSFPTALKSIGSGAFRGMTTLGKINFTPESALTEIGESAFDGCNYLMEFHCPDGVTTIGANAFRNCSVLITVTLGKSLTAVQDGTFQGCEQLNGITFPATVMSIGESAFMNCLRLAYATFEGDRLNVIAKAAFQYCLALKSIKIPEGVTELGISAFNMYGNPQLSFVELPDTITKLGQEAFGHCNGLTTVVVGKNAITSEGTGVGVRVANLFYRGENASECKANANGIFGNSQYYAYSLERPAERGYYWHYNTNDEPVAWNQ